MFPEDSLAPTHTPTDLFSSARRCQFVAPVYQGYMIEIEVQALGRLADAIENSEQIPVMADISRVKTLGYFAPQDRLGSWAIDDLWAAAPQTADGRLFIVWLAPFRDQSAQAAVLQRIEEMAAEHTLRPTFTSLRIGVGDSEPRHLTTSRHSSIARAMREYRNTGVARAAVSVPSLESLRRLVASGASYRIDPVRPIKVAAPGDGPEPDHVGDLSNEPIVAVVDGGLHAPRYRAAEAWSATALVPTAHANRKHGNSVSSLVIHAHAWNGDRNLPALNCRVGSIQAVPGPQSNQTFNDRELVDYLAEVARAHPEARVWNISANQHGVAVSDTEVSVLGHELSLLARSAGILPVISAGNVAPTNGDKLSPPADCEAAIVVGGRLADTEGKPGDKCPSCLPGPGPEGMMKPDLSWFSTLRMLGGVVATGSSYAAPLISSLAAHTFARLRDPNPDMVKALLINATERDDHDRHLGWGTPYQNHAPWVCSPGSVTLAWKASIEPGAAYYWNDIPIPQELVRDGRLFGRARLTAVLRPLVSPYGGANYFASRLETALLYNGPSKTESLLGSMKESTLAETDARAELKKWQPVRRASRDFSKRSGLQFEGNTFRLYARVFMRDLFQFGWTHHSQAGAQEVAFALTFWSNDGGDGIYNSTATALGNYVESAVLDQEIELMNPSSALE
jgi:hypothetical protein